MKPIYEPILTDENSSFKVKTYVSGDGCASAGWHIHPEYEIVYIKNGSGVLKIANKAHYYTDGALVLLAGNIPHSDMGNTEKKNNKEVVIQFTKDFVDQKLGLFPEFSTISQLIARSKNVLVFDTIVKSDLSALFERFAKLNTQEKLINFLSILQQLSVTKEYIKLLNSDMLYQYRERETDRLKKVFEYINTFYNQKILVELLAREVGLTPNSFSRFFKKMTNRTFIDFVNEFRIRKALDKMNEGDVTVTEAMYSCGFNSPSYFSKQFIKYQRMTPSTYLKTSRSLNNPATFGL